ncbi:MAG: hypothetical protein DRH15_02225 [Deltaproteobacteria bacterium]|nr:MAG: hypothetical protein DRH15_02225 [Deltaproteobacteria bacterium]
MIKLKLMVLGITSLFLTSCVYVGIFAAGAAAGIGGYKYKNGVLIVDYEAPYIKTWEACVKAVDEMGLRLEKSEHDLTKGVIKAKRADDKMVTIEVEYKTPQKTQVGIRVGIFGDEEASKVIKEKIRRILVRS